MAKGHVIYKKYPKERRGQVKAYPMWKITLEMKYDRGIYR